MAGDSTRTVADAIFTSVLGAMQEAEEIGGPEGSEYLRLMRQIEREAHQRRVAYAGSHKPRLGRRR